MPPPLETGNIGIGNISTFPLPRCRPTVYYKMIGMAMEKLLAGGKSRFGASFQAVSSFSTIDRLAAIGEKMNILG